MAGIVLLAGEVVPGLSDLDSQPQVLAYVLGYAQQVATRFLDDRAQTILNRVPSKESDSRQSGPTATTPEPGTATDGPAPG